MNLHPIFVHFPIALLTIYALAELLQIKRLQDWPPFFYIKATFSILGTLGSFAAAATGLMIDSQFSVGEAAKLVQTHKTLALITISIFLVIALVYLISWLRRAGKPLPPPLLSLERLFIEKKLIILFALIGLFAVTITGALGGAIAFGPDIDPAARFFYNLLVK
ncbi:MAG: hypothetical protein Q7R62_00465 [bacterium]|nr:hypothetical protein [bacterium]